MAYETYLAKMDPEIKPFERLTFPTKYVIPKSLTPVSHWPSKEIRIPEYNWVLGGSPHLVSG